LKRTGALLAVTLVLGGGACGKGVVPGATYDHPLLSFSGTVSPAGSLAAIQPPPQHPVVGLLWTDPLQRRPDVVMPARWLQSTVDVAQGTFTADVFRPPPPEAVVALTDGAGDVSQMALAEIVIVDDQDGDGTFRVAGARATIAAPERYLAGSANVLTYVQSPFSSAATTSPLTLPGQSGYALVNYVCQGQLSGGTHQVPTTDFEMIAQPSQDFPDVRTCRASHGP
jgi:hypothetical protein